MATKKKNDILAEAGTDAAKWTEALVTRLGELGNDALDATPGGDLFGWVANMIEAGRSEGYAKGHEDLSDAVKLYGSLDDAMRDDKVMTMVFLGGKATGKTIMSQRLADVLGTMEIDANHSVVQWPNGDEYNTLTVALDADDKSSLAKVQWVDEASAVATGRAAILKEGLNAADDLPILRLPDVNAIEFNVSADTVTLEVDGKVRAELGKPNTVILRQSGDRYVILRDGETLETPPNRVDGE